jgi:hypothetical protein
MKSTKPYGQSLVEYLVCLAAISLALCLPMGNEQPVMQQLAGALAATVRAIALLLSIS